MRISSMEYKIMLNIALNDEISHRFSPLHKKNVNKIY
jgi:hypothetical protein